MMLMTRVVIPSVFFLLFSVSIFAASGLFDGEYSGETESVAACGPSKLTFSIKDNLIDGMIEGDKGKGAIFSKSSVSPSGEAELVIGKLTNFPGRLAFFRDGTFAGTITTKCWHSVHVKGKKK